MTTDKKRLAAATLDPAISASMIIRNFEADSDPRELMRLLNDAIADVNAGDLKACEGMLMAQAHALQTMFMTMTVRANNQSDLKQFETHFKLALKSQSQCRATLETLVAIKNPPVVFVKQANISNGHQQINNGTPAPASRTEEFKNQQNELLEVQNGSETMDGGTTDATICRNKAMATVESFNRG